MINIKNIFYSSICVLVIANNCFAQTLSPDPKIIPSTAPAPQATTQVTPQAPTSSPTLTDQPTVSISSPTTVPSSGDSVSTSQAIDQIQKTLLFSNSNKDVANQLSIERKSSLNIDYSGGKTNKSQIKISIDDPSLSKKDQQIQQKQKLAYSASVAGQYEVAVELYKQILKSDPQNHYASFSLAACYHKLGQYKQAKTLYYQLLKHEWSDAQTKDQLIGNLIEVIVEETPNEAIYLLEKLVSESPESAYILAGMAMAYDKIKKPDQAVLLLKRAININPKEIRYKFNLAIIFDKMTDYQNAVTYYQEVINDYLASGETDNSVPLAQIRQRIEFIKNQNN